MALLISTFLLADCQNFQKEHNIQNNCEFDILRIKKSDIICNDYGKYNKFCNHYAQPQEFVVHNENGINGKHIIIKPSAIWEETDYGKEKLADFYYTFTCDNRNNYPKLIQNIVPTPGNDNNPLVLLIFIIVIVIMMFVFCPPNDSSNDFWFGYALGGFGGGGRRRRTFCE